MAFLLLLTFLAVSPVYASGMDGIANAGSILIGLFAAFLVSLVTGPLLRQYMGGQIPRDGPVKTLACLRNHYSGMVSLDRQLGLFR